MRHASLGRGVKGAVSRFRTAVRYSYCGGNQDGMGGRSYFAPGTESASPPCRTQQP
jgi:hypothetical protein